MHFWQLLMKTRHHQIAYRIVTVVIALGLSCNSAAQESWYQIELSIFTNEAQADRDQEQWLPGRIPLDHPSRITRLGELADLLLPESMLPEPDSTTEELTDSPEQSNLSDTPEEVTQPPSPEELKAEAIAQVGPHPRKSGPDFAFFDIQRDAFFKLAADRSDFSQTNRAIERSSDHRLLFHAVWQQPVLAENEATAILVEGGQSYGPQPELQGNLTIHFNENEDRVVLAADIWLTEFVAKIAQANTQGTSSITTAPDVVEATEEALDGAPDAAQWVLPPTPAALAAGPVQILQARRQANEIEYAAENVFHMLQSRPMRSNEFHYLDHPALGIVVQVQPYEVPPLPILDTEIETDAENNDLIGGTGETVEENQSQNTGSPAN